MRSSVIPATSLTVVATCCSAAGRSSTRNCGRLASCAGVLGVLLSCSSSAAVGRRLGNLRLGHAPLDLPHALRQPVVETLLHGAVGTHHQVQAMRVVQQPLAQQAGKQVRLRFPALAAGGKVRAETQESQWILAVDPASHDPEQGVQREHGLHFEVLEGGLAEGGLHHLGADATVGDFVQGGVDQLAETACPVALAAADAASRRWLRAPPRSCRSR